MEWHLIAAAVVTGTSLHGAMEPGHVIEKLKRLQKAIKTGKIEEPKLKGIDTRQKAYSLAVAAILIPTVMAYGVIYWINPSVESALIYIVIVALLGEIIASVRTDSYHVLIEKITQKQKSKS